MENIILKNKKSAYSIMVNCGVEIQLFATYFEDKSLLDSFDGDLNYNLFSQNVERLKEEYKSDMTFYNGSKKDCKFHWVVKFNA